MNGGRARTRTVDLLRVKQHVCSKLLMVLTALTVLEAFRRTSRLLSLYNRSTEFNKVLEFPPRLSFRNLDLHFAER